MRCFVLGIALVAGLLGPLANVADAKTHTATSGVDAKQDTVVRPAIWRVRGKHGTVYLFGSVHLLSPTLDWRTPAVKAAIAKADVFVFEIPMGQETMKATQMVIASRGTLPPGESLRAMLSPAAQADYDDDLTKLGMSAAVLDGRRPWLADLVLNVTLLTRQTGASLITGVDKSLSDEVAGEGKEMRYLETVEEQMALLAPDDPKTELEEFEADLKNIREHPTDYVDLMQSWSSGDVATLARLSSAEFKDHPDAQKVMLDDRNKRWVVKISDMLDNESKTFFITVGAAHLAGPQGVPTLLRAAGYKVVGP